LTPRRYEVVDARDERGHDGRQLMLLALSPSANV
jgi:hypothetical protein